MNKKQLISIIVVILTIVIIGTIIFLIQSNKDPSKTTDNDSTKMDKPPADIIQQYMFNDEEIKVSLPSLNGHSRADLGVKLKPINCQLVTNYIDSAIDEASSQQLIDKLKQYEADFAQIAQATATSADYDPNAYNPYYDMVIESNLYSNYDLIINYDLASSDIKALDSLFSQTDIHRIQQAQRLIHALALNDEAIKTSSNLANYLVELITQANQVCLIDYEYRNLGQAVISGDFGDRCVSGSLRTKNFVFLDGAFRVNTTKDDPTDLKASPWDIYANRRRLNDRGPVTSDCSYQSFNTNDSHKGKVMFVVPEGSDINHLSIVDVKVDFKTSSNSL